MRERPFAFLKIGPRWINFALVTDIMDHGDSVTVYLASDMARMTSGPDPVPLDVARRLTITDPDDVVMVRKWLGLSDES
jgi:hypothetical protein